MGKVELIMPKMGESIIEATIIGWTKNVGDFVEADETVCEIATDKVDSDVPSPVSGTITKIFFQKDDVVPVGAVMAMIDSEGEVADPVPDQQKTSQQDTAVISADLVQNTPSQASAQRQEPSAFVEKEVEKKKSPADHLVRRSLTNKIPSNYGGKFFSPLVRNIARAEGISLHELETIEGTGGEGRITKFDLLNYIDQRSVRPARSIANQDFSHEETELPQKTSEAIQKPSKVLPKEVTSSSDQYIELTRMRKVIANHMTNSIRTSAHVTSFVEADATKLVNWRKKVKGAFQERNGEKLTLSPLFAEAVIKALRDFPGINASMTDEHLIIKKSINLGIATAMEDGNLIVPVIKAAGELNLLGLTKNLNDITSRARVNKLNPDEIQGGTFTISNIGTYGNIMGTPIINQPQLAILALGAIQKKPVIQETPEGDIIAIRHMMFLSLSFDHRVIDGLKGGMFLNRIAHYIETFDTNRPL